MGLIERSGLDDQMERSELDIIFCRLCRRDTIYWQGETAGFFLSTFVHSVDDGPE